MTPPACPHCGAKTTPTADALCPECRSRLNEPPIPERAHPAPAVGAESRRKGLGVLMIFGGIAALFVAVMALVRGNRTDAIYTGAVGVFLAAGGVALAARGSSLGDSGRGSSESFLHPRGRYARSLIVVGVIVGVGLLTVGWEFWHTEPEESAVDISGVAEPGSYRNPYFRFHLRYGAEWQDVTPEVRKRFAEHPDARAGTSSVLLALARTPTIGRDDGASVIFMAEALPASERNISGATYLKRMLPGLQQRNDRPRDVKEEAPVTIGGLRYNRLCLKRAWGDGEVGMMYWAAIQHDHAITITGSYPSPEGLDAVETLLGRASDDTKR